MSKDQNEMHEGAEIPADIVKSVLALGRAEWGAVKAKPDSEHVSDFISTLRLTREHFDLGDDDRQMHGLYVQGTDIVLCHTGISPNSSQHARALVGAWNRLHDEALAQAKQKPATS